MKQNRSTIAPIRNEMEIGEVTLYNDSEYPFNNSVQTIALQNPMSNKEYWVFTELIESKGPIGQVKVFDKLLNGFKIAYSGSATSATFRYMVKGGIDICK